MRIPIKILLLSALFSFLLSACAANTPTPIVIVVTATPIPTSTTAKLEIPTAVKATQEPAQEVLPPSLPTGTISWEEAPLHIGETVTVCGPVMGSYYSRSSGGQPTFINIGREYPDPERFTIIIWGEDRANFPESPETLYLGETICATGKIKEYKGSAEMKVTSPSQIMIP